MRGYAVYIGTTPEAFASPKEAAELSRAMIAQHDVDVLYAAAGAAGLGMIEAARHANVKAIASTQTSVTSRRRSSPATRKLVEKARAAIVSGRAQPCVKDEEKPTAP